MMNISATAAAATLAVLIATAGATAIPTRAFAQAATAEAAATQTLTVTYAGIETQEGAIMVALFDREAAFNGGAPVRVAMIPANAASVTTTFAGLAPGRYAIKSFHDIDGDTQMSTNPMGMPIEPFAFSNNARGNMGPPTWADSAFDISGATTQNISIR
jgi:uncharacterized protein (DUF2141 family)